MAAAVPPHDALFRAGPGRTQLDGLPLDRSRLAGVLRRFCAVFIDGLLPYLIFLPLLVVAGPIALNSMDPSPSVLTTVGVGFVASYVGLQAFMAYGLVQLGRGRSPGKKMLGLRVIHLDTNAPAGFWRMMLREVVGKAVSGFLCLGFLWAIWDERKQGWHDKIAGTVVVRENPEVQ